MVSYAKVFRNNFDLFKHIVEDELGVSLGNISVFPIWKHDFNEKAESFRDKDYYRNCWINNCNLKGIAGNLGVYYPRIGFTKKDSQNSAKHTLFHELYHIGLAKFAGYDDLFDEDYECLVPKTLDEAFADKMAVYCLQKYFNVDSRKYLTYKNELSWLEHELILNSVSNEPKDVARFVLEYDIFDSSESYNIWMNKTEKIV